jgi:hypothetical protein
MTRQRQPSQYNRQRVHALSPQLHALDTLLRQGPKTLDVLAQALNIDPTLKSDPIARVRTLLSALGKHVEITVHFQYGASTYEILDKHSHQIP